MENNKLPAYPFLEFNEVGYGNAIVIYDKDGGKQILPYQPGFTKLEMAALMIAQGFVSNSPDWSESDKAANWVAVNSVKYAKAVLEEANK